MISKTEFIDACAAACDNGTFVTFKHDTSSLSTQFNKPRSVNCMDNSAMANYLRTGDFNVHCYADSDPAHTPELYVISPNDSSIVPGSGVTAMSTTPTTQCDVFSVPSGYQQGWHGFAYDSAKVSSRESAGKLSLIGKLI